MIISCPYCKFSKDVIRSIVKAVNVTCPKCQGKFRLIHHSLEDDQPSVIAQANPTFKVPANQIETEEGELQEIAEKKTTDDETEQNLSPFEVKEKEEPPKSLGENIAEDAKIGCSSAIGAFIIGGLVSLIPVIGWVIGPIIIFSGCIMPFFCVGSAVKETIKGKTKVWRDITGPCPYCTGLNYITVKSFDEVVGVDCRICKKRFVAREKQFFPV